MGAGNEFKVYLSVFKVDYETKLIVLFLMLDNLPVDLTVCSLDGLCYELISGSGHTLAALNFKNKHYNEAWLQKEVTFELEQLTDVTWATIFKDPVAEKLVVSIKLEDSRFIIRNLYTRIKYLFYYEKLESKFLFCSDEGQIMFKLRNVQMKNEIDHTFEIRVDPEFCTESDWFMMVHAIYCAINYPRLMDPLSVTKFLEE